VSGAGFEHGVTLEHQLLLNVAQHGYLLLPRDEGLWRDFLAANELHASRGPGRGPSAAGGAHLAPRIAVEGLVGARVGAAR
jgi:hypothetical protein